MKWRKYNQYGEDIESVSMSLSKYIINGGDVISESTAGKMA
jgi:hypothetical protein